MAPVSVERKTDNSYSTQNECEKSIGERRSFPVFNPPLQLSYVEDPSGLNQDKPFDINQLQNLGFNLNILNDEGELALCQAVYGKNRELIEKLFTHGASANLLDKYGNSPLIYAVTNNDEKTFQLLLSHGADPCVRNLKTNCNAFDTAILEKSHTLVDIMLNSKHGLLLTSSSYCDANFESTLQLSKSGNIDIDSQDIYGRTALINAVIYRNSVYVYKLLIAGANLLKFDAHGKNALEYAIEAGNEDICRRNTRYRI